MRLLLALLIVGLSLDAGLDAQSRRSRSGSRAPARQTPARTTPAKPAGPTRVQATLVCPSELGVGVTTRRTFCDVLAGRDPAAGVRITIPPHRGPVTLSFELHNRHTYSDDQIKTKTAYRKYTATIGVLSMDNTLVDRAVIQSEFRQAGDLFDRIAGGAGPGGVKAVAPTGTEFISMELPEDIGTEVSVLGEKLTVVRPDGTDVFTSEGRPVATISNVMVEFRPGPAPRTPAPARKPSGRR
ncbi:MAG: hypothetical protein FJW29_06410 [Acidobacteria bacterium]|nr:hypothetical protein [Acidobacteriota bacterium]